MKVWLIADTHFNHENIKTYCQRPDDFTERLKQNWSYLVAPADLVIHLGDVIIGCHKQTTKELLDSLPGRKVLILGNHDRGRGSATWWMRNGFDFACQGLIFRSVWLTHEPASGLTPGTDVNIHGHLHNIWDGFRGAGPYLPKPFHRLFAVEYTGLAPVEFEKFLRRPKKYREVPPSNWRPKWQNF